MNQYLGLACIVVLGLAAPGRRLEGQVIFETTSPYHHIRVTDEGRLRILGFDNATESRISLDDPLQGHFEYTEYFHLPWLWNDRIKSALMIGLGGGSIQRAYQHYYPAVQSETVELDPKVAQVARDYFQVKESDSLKILVGDGRMHLRRTPKKYDVILMDAYTANRYGSFIPYSLVTQEFFTLASDHLSDRGVLAYNVIGNVRGGRENIVGAIYRTLKSVFPQVYVFPAFSSLNVVLIATKSPEALTLSQLRQKAEEMIAAQKLNFPNLLTRLRALRPGPPPAAARSRILTDDFAPVDGLLSTE